MRIFPDPVERMQIAQPAFAVLNIGFDNIAAVAHFLVPFVAFRHFQRDKLRRGFADDFGPKPVGRFVINVAIAPHKPTF